MTVSLLWFRQNLRVHDNPALQTAVAEGPVVPVYVLDDDGAADRKMGPAQRWWLHHSLNALDQSLMKRGNGLVLRRGNVAAQLLALAEAIGATRVHTMRQYEPWEKRAENAVAGVLDLVVHDGNHLEPPENVCGAAGQRYPLFTPWYRTLIARMPPGIPIPAPQFIRSVAGGTRAFSERLDLWNLLPRSPDWAKGFTDWCPGEKGAWRAARSFYSKVNKYKELRDFPGAVATSRLSPHLHFGEISPRSLWHLFEDSRGSGPDMFRAELGWREYATSLIDQLPDYGARHGHRLFECFRWRNGEDAERDFRAWTQGRTGYPIVDAGMRELWHTGWMHNRLRMITASFLVKHLLIDWRRGERWFWDTLLDADYAANAMNWQYVAGTGVETPPFSRIIAPRLQSERFDMAGYVRRYVPEISHLSDQDIYQAHLTGAKVPTYPEPIVPHQLARARALCAWQTAHACVTVAKSSAENADP